MRGRWWLDKPECKVQQIISSVLRTLEPLMSQCVAVVATILGRNEYWRWGGSQYFLTFE